MNIHCTFTDINDKSAYQKFKYNHEQLSHSTEYSFYIEA